MDTIQYDKQEFSEYISDFCKVIENAIKDYNFYASEVSRMDKLQQDYLHLLELGELKYRERAKIATKIQECRKYRRKCKNVVQTLYPVVEYMCDGKGKYVLNQMREVLGRVRKIEKSLDYRVYSPRVLEMDPIFPKSK